MPAPKPVTVFDWPLYADATFAGLACLTPVIFVDSLLEWFFRERQPTSIAQHRNSPLAVEVVRELNYESLNWVWGCVFFPLWLGVQLLKRFSKKILYFLTIKEATDKLSTYWHRAFLLDYALQCGHLTNVASARRVRLALAQVLRTHTTSPIEQLAREVVRQGTNIAGSLRRVRRGEGEDATIQAKKSLMNAAWANLAQYWGEVAERYLAAYAALASPEAEKP